ncbi:MAG: VWA domain-containing protein, partial [Bacteroidales bacterium]|nr:VWA domain-containing protein [Bacteroidales bacterium]
MSIFSEISLWFIPLCLAVGVGLAYVLYRHKFQLPDVSRSTIVMLFCLRAFSMSLVCALLLNIFVDIRSKHIEKPTIVFLHDNSSSITMLADSNFYRHNYPHEVQKLCASLEQSHNVAFYQFGEHFSHDTTLNFTDRQTNISQALQEIHSRYANKNIGAIVLASDGIYNSGENPLYTLKNTGITELVYCIALGDSAQQRDNVIQSVLANNIAFKNVPFRISIQSQSFNIQGKTSKIQVFNESHKLFETTLHAHSAAEFNEIPCTLVAQKAGQTLYKVVIETHEGEINRI